MRDDLLQAIKPREETVKLGELTLVLRELQTASDVSEFKDDGDRAYKLLVLCAFHEDGTPAFSDDDIPALKAASKSKVGMLTGPLMRVNGFDIEENVKNSEADPSSG